ATAEVGDSHGERDARAGRRLVEDHGDGLRTFERLLAPTILLQLRGEIENLGLLGGGNRVVAEGVAGHEAFSWLVATASSDAVKRSRNSAMSSSPIVYAGARRITFAAGALMIRPRSNAAAATSAATGASSTIP